MSLTCIESGGERVSKIEEISGLGRQRAEARNVAESSEESWERELLEFNSGCLNMVMYPIFKP